MAKHNNIDPTIGNFYHYCIVVSKLFLLKKNEKLVIEVYGDLTKVRINDNYFLENYEIKHHKDSNTLNYSNIDFWKTIKNWVENVDSYSSDTKLILYTTSTKDESLLNFNKKTKDEKLNLLTDWKDKTKNSEINDLNKTIFKNKTKLKNVLSKIQFETDMVKYEKVRNKIIEDNHIYFNIFKENTTIKIKAINYFIAEIISALKNKTNWEITDIQFRDIINDFADRNKIDNIKVEESDLKINVDEDNKLKEDLVSQPLYIQKLQEINLSQQKIKRASRHKIRAINFISQIQGNSFTYGKKIEKCAEVFIDHLDEIKSDYDFEKDVSLNIENSKKVFDNAMKIDKLCLVDEDQTTSFRKGFWHILANDKEKKDIYWLIKDEEK